MVMAKDEAFEIMEKVLGLSKADETEVLLSAHRSALTRFANSIIHQNVATKDATVNVRAVFGKKIGVAEVNKTDTASLREVVARAGAIARVQKPNKDFKALPKGGQIKEVDNYSKRTAASTPEQRAEAVRRVVAVAKEAGVKAFGALGASTHVVAVMNSRGAQAYDDMTSSRLTVTAIATDGERKGYGWAEDAHRDIGRLRPEVQAERASHKARESLGARALEPGEYPVVLEPPAVADIVTTLGFTTFGALEYQEGRSYIVNRLGKRIVAEEFSLWDDGLAPGGFPMAFDFEGVPKRRVELIADGIAQGLVYDSYTAGREEGKESTGHALPAPNPFGPFPMNMFLESGDATMEEMIEDTRRGVYVTRFHYTNTIDPTKTLWTGMTRDGTFLVEDGEVKAAVRNLRFTDGIVDALAAGGVVGKEVQDLPFSDYFPAGGTSAPMVKLNRFRFTGSTE